MRHFLPIKGPGGRALTAKEKVALVVLAVTLILCVLTLLAGDGAFGPEPARNPVFAVVRALARSVGVGIIGLYAIVMLWSSLIFFKGERVAEDKPMPGRVMAAIGIAVGISGMLGLAQLDAAGELGSLVGGAVGNAFGAVFGFAVLLTMLVLGGHLAGQGAWAALRGGAPSASAATAPPPTGGFTLPQKSPRVGGAECLPDDGDPTADERSRAIAQAMEEIERSKGVTIVEVNPERTSIGEEVEANAEQEPHADEAQVQSALDDVATALANLQSRLDREQAEAEAAQDDAAEDEEEPGDVARAATVTRPVEESDEVGEDAWAGEDEEEEEDRDEPDEKAGYDDEEDEEDEEEEFDDEDEDAEYEDDEEEDEDEESEYDDEDDEDGEDDEDEEYDRDEDDYDDEDLDDEEFEREDEDDEWDEEAQLVEEEDEDGAAEEPSRRRSPTPVSQPYLFPVARREVDEDRERRGGEEDAAAGRRSTGIEAEEAAEADTVSDGSEGTRFDWRGRPLD